MTKTTKKEKSEEGWEPIKFKWDIPYVTKVRGIGGVRFIVTEIKPRGK